MKMKTSKLLNIIDEKKKAGNVFNGISDFNIPLQRFVKLVHVCVGCTAAAIAVPLIILFLLIIVLVIAAVWAYRRYTVVELQLRVKLLSD